MDIQSTDQIGNTVNIQFPPKRIVSLVPSQTEFLFDIGLDSEIMGITRFCIHPEEKVKGKTKIGGTKKFDLAKIRSLQPDLIIGNKEENYKEGIDELSSLYPVWVSDIFTLEDSYAMMRELGRITDKESEAGNLITTIKNGFSSLQGGQIQGNRKSSCAYFIWRKPYMVAAGNTFINHMLSLIGLSNVFATQQRYPVIVPEMLGDLKPDFIFLSSEPYSFSEKHFEEFKSFAPAAKIILADGEIFSWYGSRLKLAPAYFNDLRGRLIS